MSYEVEQKFPVDEVGPIQARLAKMDVVIGEPFTEVDWYYAHPSRDFRQTDEALRLRRHDGANRITYKGPKVDQVTKTRQEIELPLPEGTGVTRDWAGLLERLGFRPVGEVQKTRRKAHLDWQGHAVEVSFDQLEEIGSFVELETVADEEAVDQARQAIADLAAHLGLKRSERRSYLHLVLAARGER